MYQSANIFLQFFCTNKALFSISRIALLQAVYLLSGRAMVNRLKSKIQPKIVLISSGLASASNLLRAAISSLGIGSDTCFGGAAV